MGKRSEQFKQDIAIIRKVALDAKRRHDTPGAEGGSYVGFPENKLFYETFTPDFVLTILDRIDKLEGEPPADDLVNCLSCGGSGQKEYYREVYPCHLCNGTGRLVKVGAGDPEASREALIEGATPNGATWDDWVRYGWGGKE